MQAPEGTIFDLYDEAGKEERQKTKKRRPKTAQAIREVGLGMAQGAGDIVQMAGMLEGAIQAPLTYGLLSEEQRKETQLPGEKARTQMLFDPDITESQFAALAVDDDLIPPTQLPGGRTALGEALEEIPEEGTLQEIVRRGTRTLAFAPAGAAAMAEMGTRELMGLGGKKIAENLGLGETAQTLFDVGFSLTPVPKKFIKGGSAIIKMAEQGKFTTQKQMVDTAKKLGMTEQEIAPLVREGWFADILRKISPRRGGTEKALHATKAGVGRAFETIRESDIARNALTKGSRGAFIKNLESGLADLSTGAKDAIAGDLADLMNSKMTGRDLMVFWDKINDYWKQYPKLGKLKGSLKKALGSISPELSSDFEMANTLSQRFRDVASKLKPNVATDIAGLGEVGVVFSSLLKGGLPVLMKTAPYSLGIPAARKLAQLMSTSARFQNLHKKMITTVNAGQVKATKKILDQMVGMIQKESPETAAELQKITMEDLEEMLKGAD